MHGRRSKSRDCVVICVLLVVFAGVAGCDWLNSLSFDLYIPLGLDGSFGLFNPDGGAIWFDPVEFPTNGGDAVIPPDVL
ncbi:MAG: hypothetical protein JXQ73_26475 [Phycisphaerae bacterium]|nr:hypothetical protein [Phycisphaerae bacterium]